MFCYKSLKTVQLIFFVSLLMFSISSYAQGMAVGGGVDRANMSTISAQISTLNTIIRSLNTTLQAQGVRLTNTEIALNKVTVCNDKGMVYDPDGDGKDTDDCISSGGGGAITDYSNLPSGTIAGRCKVDGDGYPTGEAIAPAVAYRASCGCVSGWSGLGLVVQSIRYYGRGAYYTCMKN